MERKINANGIFTRPEVKQNWITEAQVAEVIVWVKDHPRRREVFNKYAHVDNFIYANEYIMYNMDIAAVTKILNTLSAFDQYEQVVVGQLSLRIPLGSLPIVNAFNYEFVKTTIAYGIIEALKDLNYITHRQELVKEINETSGKVTWRHQNLITFGVKDVDSDYIAGIHQKPGVVMQKRFKVRAGGKALKLNKPAKEILKLAGSFKLRMIRDFTIEEFIDMAKSEQDYINVKLEKVRDYHILIADDLVARQAKKFQTIQSLDEFYLSMWMDYRTRLYYDFSEQYMSPSVQKWLFEAADAVKVTEQFRDDMKYSAVVIVDGRCTHHEGVERYNSKPEFYQEELRKTKYTMREGKSGEKDYKVISYKETVYNRRLADAILADETHFLLGEDATNGGLQHGGIGFRSPKMMRLGNISGEATQIDSHGESAEKFGMDRDDYKKQVSQGLFHGEALASIARKLSITKEECKAYMIDAFGYEILNIEEIANWGSLVVNNDNTSLMFTTADGIPAQSLSYTKSVPLTVYALNEANKSGYTQTKLHKEMPLLVDAKGNPVYGKDKGGNKVLGGDVKIRGLYANITHSIDATALRNVIRALHKAGVKAALFVHDNFFVPERMDVVRHAYKQSLIEEFERSSYVKAIEEIRENYVGVCPECNIIMGTATIDMVKAARYYLAA